MRLSFTLSKLNLTQMASELSLLVCMSLYSKNHLDKDHTD